MPIVDLLTETLDIERLVAGGEDSLGNPTDAFASHLSAVPTRVEFRTGTEDRAGRTVTIQFWVAWVLAAIDVVEEDRVIYNGRTFDINAVKPLRLPSGAHHQEIRMDEAV